MRHELFQQVLGNQLTYLSEYMLGTPLHLLGRDLPDGKRPAGLLFLEYPEASLRQEATDGADSDGMSFPLADLVVLPIDVLRLPGGVVTVAGDDVAALMKAHLGY